MKTPLIFAFAAAVLLGGCDSGFKETKLPPQSVQSEVSKLPTQVKDNPNISNSTKQALAHAIPGQ